MKFSKIWTRIKKNNDTASDCSSRSSHTSNESDNEVDISDIDINDMIEEYNNIKILS